MVEALCELFPQADLFALVADRNVLSPELQKHKLTTSFLQNLPGSRRWHRHMLPLYPLAVEQFDLRGYDLVISLESGPSKGVITAPETCHICYCLTPMRYIWNFYQDYKNGSGLGLGGKDRLWANGTLRPPLGPGERLPRGSFRGDFPHCSRTSQKVLPARG